MENDRLYKAYVTAHEATKAAFSGPPSQFVRLRAASNEAWLAFEMARMELERHQREHGKA
jgi:hypothetical protein